MMLEVREGDTISFEIIRETEEGSKTLSVQLTITADCLVEY